MFLFFFLFSCNKIDAVRCKDLQNRVESIQEQRKVLLELYRLDRLGKKKFKTFDEMLSDEEAVEIRLLRTRCTEK